LVVAGRAVGLMERGFAAGMRRVDPEVIVAGPSRRGRVGPGRTFAGTPLAWFRGTTRILLEERGAQRAKPTRRSVVIESRRRR